MAEDKRAGITVKALLSGVVDVSSEVEEAIALGSQGDVTAEVQKQVLEAFVVIMEGVFCG